MPLKIIAVQPRSLAARVGVRALDTLLSINSMPVNDFFDLEYYANDYQLDLDLLDPAGTPKAVTIFRQSNKTLGIEPEPYNHRYCRNNCVFCFIDQMPKGMRPSLYNKDDDYLYSYVFGNYITLNNLTREDIRRIVDQHISPLYISVHSSDQDLRHSLMRYRDNFDILNTLRLLADAGISYHLQIVCVPGFNCGEELRRTLRDLLDPSLATLSLGIVPVGLTDHRAGLSPLQPFTAELARETLDIIAEFKAHNPVVYAADELFVQAGQPIPEENYYGDFPQLENGIGMLRLTLINFQKKKRALLKELDRAAGSFLLLTSRSAAATLQSCAEELNARLSESRVRVQILRNDYFGQQISVSGLLTASDLLGQQQAEPDEAIILPSNVFNHEGNTLDDVSQLELRARLGRPVLVVDQLMEDWEWL